jgi:hypothetical protein
MQRASSTWPNRDSLKKAAQYIVTGGITAAIVVGCCVCPAYVLENHGSGTLAYLLGIALITGATIGYIGNRVRRRLFFVGVGAGLGAMTGLLLVAVFASVLIGIIGGIMTGCILVLPNFQVSPKT